MAAGSWKTPKSESLEDFVLFVIRAASRAAWALIILAVAIYAIRYGLTAEALEPPWNDLPVIGQAPG